MNDYSHIKALHYRELRRVRKAVLERLREIEQPRGPPKYGLLNRGFQTEEEYLRVLSQMSSEQAQLISRLERYLGLRVGEAVSIETEDFDRVRRMLWVRSEKGSYPALFPLLDNVFPYMCAWVDAGKAGKRYFFPSKHKANRRGHVSPHWVAKEFREARAKAGLNMIYDYSLPCGKLGRRRPLYRLSTHSSRHTFITDVHNKLGDLLVTQKLARHRDIRSTLHYTFKSQEQLHEAFVTVFTK